MLKDKRMTSRIMNPFSMLSFGLAIGAVSILSSILLFDRLRIYDFLIDGTLIYFLFFKKVNR